MQQQQNNEDFCTHTFLIINKIILFFPRSKNTFQKHVLYFPVHHVKYDNNNKKQHEIKCTLCTQRCHFTIISTEKDTNAFIKGNFVYPAKTFPLSSSSSSSDICVFSLRRGKRQDEKVRKEDEKTLKVKVMVVVAVVRWWLTSRKVTHFLLLSFSHTPHKGLFRRFLRLEDTPFSKRIKYT